MGEKIKVQKACHRKKFSTQTNAFRTPNDSIKSSHLYGQTLMLSFAFLHILIKTLNFFSCVIFSLFVFFGFLCGMLYPKYYHNSIIFLLKRNQINVIPYTNSTCTEKYQKVIKSVL